MPVKKDEAAAKTNLAFSFKKFSDSDDKGKDLPPPVTKTSEPRNPFLPPQDAIGLEEETAKYNQEDPWDFPVIRREGKGPGPPRYSPKVNKCSKPKSPSIHPTPLSWSEPAFWFQRAVREAESNGELDFSLCCPVVL